MATDNPKVSAYVPQTLKDRLKEFRQERGNIPESQAVIIILAEYFQMPEVLGRLLEGSSVGGVTLARMEVLEEKLATLAVLPSSIPSELLEKIDQLSVMVESLDKRIETVEHSGLLSRLNSELQETDLVAATKETEDVISQGEQFLEADSLPINEGVDNKQLELIQPVLNKSLVEPLDEIKPIPGVKLSELRFGCPKAAIAGIKKRNTIDELIEWTRQKDPDHIAWKFVDSPTKGYMPAEELSSEQKSSLLKWIKENIR